jgi:hypothetical protein
MFTSYSLITRDILAALRRYIPAAASGGGDGAVRILVILPQGSDTMAGVALVAEDITSFNSAAATAVMDNERHAYRAYMAAEGK